MNVPRRVSWVLAVAACFAPLGISDAAVRIAEASCSGGTCCPEVGSDCVINNILTKESYAKLSGGRCKAVDARRA